MFVPRKIWQPWLHVATAPSLKWETSFMHNELGSKYLNWFFPIYFSSDFSSVLAITPISLSSGWPDWANFRPLGECLLWATFSKISKVCILILGYACTFFTVKAMH
jgi:hypothetical protein